MYQDLALDAHFWWLGEGLGGLGEGLGRLGGGGGGGECSKNVYQ